MKKYRWLLAFLPITAHAELTDWIQPISAISAGDTAWVMLAAILVLFMTIPGLALFYAEWFVRKISLPQWYKVSLFAA